MENGEGTSHWVGALAATAFCTVASSQALTDDDPPVEVIHRTVPAFLTYKENDNHQCGILRTRQAAAEFQAFGKHVELEAADFIPHQEGGFESIPNTVNETRIVDVTIQEVTKLFAWTKAIFVVYQDLLDALLTQYPG